MLNNHLLETKYFISGRTKLCVSIAGVSCVVISRDSASLEQLMEKYQRYESTGPVEYEIMVQFYPLNAFPRKNPTSTPLVKRVNSGSNYLIKRANQPFLAVANTVTKKILVKMYCNQVCFDSFYQILYNLILAEKGGLLLHAYAINDNGQANVFFKSSNAVKSTPGYPFSDSNSMTGYLGIVKSRNNQFRVYNTPFQEEQITDRINNRADLRASYLLKREHDNDLIALKKLPAVVALYRSASYFTDDRQLLGRVLYTCNKIVNSVPAFELHFRRDSFISLLN